MEKRFKNTYALGIRNLCHIISQYSFLIYCQSEKTRSKKYVERSSLRATEFACSNVIMKIRNAKLNSQREGSWLARKFKLTRQSKDSVFLEGRGGTICVKKGFTLALRKRGVINEGEKNIGVQSHPRFSRTRVSSAESHKNETNIHKPVERLESSLRSLATEHTITFRL